MLDTETKRRIDTARDILVGKLPDPKSQVEQITIALVYKFMDDMDARSEVLGGERTFFDGDFQKYGWARLMRGGLGGHEMLALYSEAITRMPENPGIPPLFRDIFKNAYLPYRDPETLRAFLKVIDDFEYDHSERLGDAFEYLLSVLGSQGDAGQFRTPRHIIDFIVSIVDPKKDETVLDPACGTAGFLISAYKHILKANTDDNGNTTLTPIDRERLAANFRGYDISPDMVRLSLVNMYLHGFPDPQIHEYDTLTSLDRWSEHADVILANPPFMSPKGGIRPHARFSVQSNRSEVLFIDYMAEHLTPHGRAGIIVPEGINFQGQTAYRQLRRMLVDGYLVAVISLPAGVFNPYSAVKTSILFLDKETAQNSETVAFFGITNDGFGLGAQRRPTEKNDLPQAHAELAEYLRLVRGRRSLESFRPTLGLVVEKERIAADGDYHLGAERYRQSEPRSSQFPIVPLGTVATVIAGQSPPGESYNESGIGVPFYQGKTEFGDVFLGKPAKWTTEPQRLAEEGDVLMSVRAPVGPVNLAPERICIGRGLAAIRPAPGRLLPRYAFYVLRAMESEIKGDVGAAFASINRGAIEELRVPLPPLEVQDEIVAEIEDYQSIIAGSRSVVDHYHPRIPIHPDWPIVEVGTLTRPEYGFTAAAAESGDARFVRITDVASDGSLRADGGKFITLSSDARRFLLTPGDILVARTGATFGKTMMFTEDYPAVFASYLIRLRFPPDLVLPRYYWVFAQSQNYWSQARSLMSGGGQPQFNGNALSRIRLPLPPIAVQQAVVAEFDAEQPLIRANRQLIDHFGAKIHATISRVWVAGESAQAGA